MVLAMTTGCGLVWGGAVATLLACSVAACGNGADATQLGDPSIDSAQAAARSSGGAAAEPGTLVFRSDRDRAGIGDLYVMALDGSSVRRLTEDGDYFMPLWSPAGDSIAFRQITGLSAAVGLISFSGDSSVLLVSDLDPELTTDHSLAWSAADELIYDSHETGPDTDLRVVSRSGSQRDNFFPTRDGRRYQADVFSKDGRIAFTWTPEAFRSEKFSAGDRDVWVATAPDDPAPENLTERRVYAPFDPRWSPDGTKIAFQAFAFLPDGTVEGLGSHSDGSTYPDLELYVIDVSTHELTRLTDNDTDDQNPTWTPDGKSLIFMSSRDGDEDIWMMPVDAPDQAVDLVDDAAAPAADDTPNCFLGVPAQ
jgi:Tol biopolymer transport system component